MGIKSKDQIIREADYGAGVCFFLLQSLGNYTSKKAFKYFFHPL